MEIVVEQIKAGINASETGVISTNDKYHILFSRRFDKKES